MRTEIRQHVVGQDIHRDRLLRRVYSEFIEMPGLRLTCAQAQRLLGLDEVTCRSLLDLLVAAKFLCRPSEGVYARSTDGHVDYPPLRMARAPEGREAAQAGRRMEAADPDHPGLSARKLRP